jgi:hypothetical protein
VHRTGGHQRSHQMKKRMARTPQAGADARKKELISLLRDNARRHRLHEVFSDFVELSALTISNAVDRIQYEPREARYLQIVQRYEREEVERFPRMFAALVEWMEEGFADNLGDLFMSLDMGDRWKGQFFTPFSVAALMARLSLGDVRAQIERDGLVSINEPACGAGGMLVACAETLHEQGINFQQAMHATAIDIDATAVHMTYVQLSLRHVPAIVIHGNALAMEERAHWVTPAHVLGGWDRRLRQRDAAHEMAVKSFMRSRLSGEDAPVAAVDSVARQIVALRAGQLGLF